MYWHGANFIDVWNALISNPRRVCPDNGISEKTGIVIPSAALCWNSSLVSLVESSLLLHWDERTYFLEYIFNQAHSWADRLRLFVCLLDRPRDKFYIIRLENACSNSSHLRWYVATGFTFRSLYYDLEMWIWVELNAAISQCTLMFRKSESSTDFCNHLLRHICCGIVFHRDSHHQFVCETEGCRLDCKWEGCGVCSWTVFGGVWIDQVKKNSCVGKNIIVKMWVNWP